jgi:hypothetical protein
MWDDFKDAFDIEDEPCNYFMKYIKDANYKIEYEKKKVDIKLLITKSYWLKQLVGGMYEYCVGGCGKTYDENNTIRFRGRAINLCFECFVDKNEELLQKYHIKNITKGKCFIEIDNL